MPSAFDSVSPSVQSQLDAKADDAGLAAVTPIPSVAVVNNSARITINSATPVVVMAADITLPRPARVEIAGILSGAFEHVSGIACYVNGLAINTGTGTNRCHPDCFLTMYGSGRSNFIKAQSYHTVSEELPVGTHRIEIATLAHWTDGPRVTYINNRSANDMASASSLIVRPL